MGLVSRAQLFNISWSAHRLSPLHHSKDHRVLIGNQDALKTYAKRLHDLLAGDLLRSMQVNLTKSLADDALSKAGSLVESRWEFITTHESIQEGSDDSSIEMNECMGIFITLDYERIGYRAALLAGPDGYTPASTDRRRKQSTHLPLLLTRMPTVLRNTFIEFLSTTFDSYCATLHLPSEFLSMTLETSISRLMTSEDSQQASNATLEQVLKETQLTLSFGQLVAPSLKSLDISLPRETLSTFARGGPNNDTSLFLSSLSQYLDKHLAMKVNLQETGNESCESKDTQHVWLSKVATGAFVLSAEGRFKLIDISSRQREPPEEQTAVQKLIDLANEQILRSLVRRAAGDDLIT
ncbi:hypothetical protein UA08_01713 [Talaromyces atroroseus]|uniref:Uncharacterized protein n=1 Tax=Talaromyces atroroseus TaxID=1441469 RepID=A0A1Q5QBH6_TALAT|nr:hypothetical protein UA08_01713 [Talaromyces atroroseus]OKL63293.1 hypothetical protein UA08_01713 [Talaromyces atroroseus]